MDRSQRARAEHRAPAHAVVAVHTDGAPICPGSTSPRRRRAHGARLAQLDRLESAVPGRLRAAPHATVAAARARGRCRHRCRRQHRYPHLVDGELRGLSWPGARVRAKSAGANRDGPQSRAERAGARDGVLFAFALHDKARGVPFCARDRYGEKPFRICPTSPPKAPAAGPLSRRGSRNRAFMAAITRLPVSCRRREVPFGIKRGMLSLKRKTVTIGQSRKHISRSFICLQMVLHASLTACSSKRLFGRLCG